MTDIDVFPPGAHPRDRSVPVDRAVRDHNAAVPGDTAQGMLGAQGRKPWDWRNAAALGVFQRLASTWACGVHTVDAQNGGSIKVVGERRGRTRLTLWVPVAFFAGGGTLTTAPAGVVIAEDEGKSQQGMGVPLFVGDSMDVFSEGGVYAALQPGQTSGIVAWLDCWDAESFGSQT